MGFDRQAALRRLGGREDFLRRLSSDFTRELPDRVKQLRLTLEERDTAELARLAHSMKSAAATVGAASMHDISTLLEKAAKENNLPLAEAALSRLEKDLKSRTDQ